MVVLNGKNLGEKQRDLNLKVAEAVANKKNFDEIKMEDETTDIDRLYKIDIASQYEDINYIIETLKSGDSLYISRALKCLWVFKDTYSHVINTEHLHNHIFPYMSMKMKKKMLSTISVHVRNMDRAATFFTYCRGNEMSSIGLKFLNSTSEDFKLNILRNEGKGIILHLNSQRLLENLIGTSFALATACIEVSEWQKEKTLYNLRFMYSVCNKKYLDLLEEHESISSNSHVVLKRFGNRISKDIMVRHKNRVLGNPLLYVNKLNKDMVVRFSTKEDAVHYLTKVMPPKEEEFWNTNYVGRYNYLLNLIPTDERFERMKQLFISKYPGAPFEMTTEFYNFKYYEMMTMEEREIWALNHIEEQKEILGSGNDYLWYQFVNTDKALVEIKKYIMITPDNYKRSNILNVLVDSARDQKDLIKVLRYYYDRHINETVCYKEYFIDKVVTVHNVFEFDNDCWEALNKLFCSLEIYVRGRNFGRTTLKAVSAAYHILNNKDMPEALIDFIDLDINYSNFSLLLNKLGQDKSEIIFQYLLKYSVDKLEQFEQDPDNIELRKNLKQYVNNIFTLLSCFRKDDKLCPEIAKRCLAITVSPKLEKRKKVTAKEIFRLLKTDASLVVDILLYYKDTIEGWPNILNKVLRKLKVYFPNDIAKEYIIFFERWLSKTSDDYGSRIFINAAIFGIFQLADQNYKISLMEKFQPVEAKIDHATVDRKLLFIQEAICRFVGYSRPPVPLENVLKYMKGDYVQYCLQIFNMYLASLPPPLLMKLTEAALNAPLSVRKHGLRIAFKCYNCRDLKNLLVDIWKMTKNVSLRMILYKSLLDKIIEANGDTQTVLYEAIKLFTLDLHQDDHNDLFNLLSSDRMLNKFRGDYLQTGWMMAVKLPEKPININRQCAIIESIERNINLVQKEFVRNHIMEEHVLDILENKRLRPHETNEIEELRHAKWQLIAKYIVVCDNSEELEERLKLLSHIFKTCTDMWNEMYEEKYLSRKFYFEFVESIKSKGITAHENSWNYNISILQHILYMFNNILPITEIYITVWDLQLSIYCRLSAGLKHLSPGEICANFANQIGAFIKDLLDKHQFYTSFLVEIADLLNDRFQDIRQILREHPQFNDIHDTLFCESLINIGMKETHLLTLMLMPTYEPEMQERHRAMLRTIQAFDNDEVQSFLYQKCVLGDYKNRL